MGYSDFVARLRPDLFDAYGDDQQDPVKLPDIQNPSIAPVQIAPTQQNIPAPEIDPHQAAIESIFGKARPNFGIALPETNLKPATNDYQPPKVKARVGSVSSAKVPKQTGTIEGSVEAKNPYTGGSTNPTLPNELGGNFKTYDDLMNWKPSSGFQSGAPLAQYVDLQRRLKDLPRPDRDFKTLDEFNQWYREAQQGQNAQNQPQRQQQQSSQSVRNRAAEAARAMKHLEYTKQQALDLFDQANNTQNVGQDSELRQRAEYQLEAANELGRKYAKSYGDLLEIGFGSDPNSTYPSGQPRQWVYVKPKDSQVTYESTRQDLQSGQRRRGRQADAYKQQQIDRLEGIDTGQTYIDPKAEQEARDIQGQGVLHGAFNRFAGAAIRGATAIPEGFARIGDTIAGYAGEAELAMDPEFQKMSPEQQSEIRRKVAQQDPSLGDRLEGVSKFGSNLADDVVPIDKSRKGSINPLTGEFWEVTMPEAAGSMVPFMASAGIGGALGLPSRLIAGTVGAAMEVPEQYAEARDAGGTPEQMRRATLTGVGAGALEAVGAESLMGKLGFHGKSPVGHLAHEAIQEGLQEGSQQFVENVGAKYFSKHDPNRSLSKDVLENAVPALFLGAGGAAMGMPGHLREQRAEVDQVAAERQSSPEFTPSAPEGTQTQVTKLRIVAQQIKDLADASPEHPVVQTVKQLGIDPVTIPQANDQAIEALSEGLKTIAETHTQLAELEQQKGTADQQLQNVQDQLRMGRVPTDAEQQQAQQGQVVAQQIEQNIQQQQAVIDDLAQNVSPLFKNLAKAIGAKEKSIEPIGDAADDATKSLVSEVRKVGGISASEGTVEKGELDRLSPKESGTTGLIRREGGTSADQMREQMASEGLTKAETAQDFISEVENEVKRGKKGESESFDDYQRGQMSDTERSDSDLLDSLSTDRAHPFTRVYRALDNTKTVYTPRLAKDFVREADKAGFSGDFIENALGDFKSRRGLVPKEEAEVTPKPQASNRTVTQYRQMVDSNKPAIDRLHSLNLNSEEAKGLIAGIQQFNKREGISPHHLGNLLDGIKDWQAHHPPKGLEGRGTPKQPQISATRNSETPNAQPARSEPTPKLSIRGAFTLDQRKMLGRDPESLLDSEFDDHLRALEEMQQQAVRNSEYGGIPANKSEYNAVVSKIIETKAERAKRVEAHRLPALHEPREKPRKLSKKELGEALVASAKARREKQDTDLQSSKSLENQQVEISQPDKAEKGDTNLRAIDEAAHEAATSPKNDLPEPTEAQKEAGNYKKGHINIHGLDVTIENPQGSVRSGKDRGGKEWSVEMSAHYGYIRRTEGADGEQVDVYIGDNPESKKVFVVDQVDAKTKAFDEHKVILGANQESEATRLYDQHFSDGKGHLRRGAVTEMSIDEFKDWLKNEDNTKPLALKENAVSVGSKVSEAAEGETGTLGDAPVSPREFKVNDYVVFNEPVVQYKNGESFTSTKQVRGKILEIQPNGDLYLRRQDGGYATKSPSEIVQPKEAKSDERSSDSTRSDENKPGDDRGPGDTASPTDAGTVSKPEKAGTKPRGSVSKRGGRGTTRGSQPTAPSLFGDNAVQSSDQSDSQQTATKAELIADVEAQTQELSSGEAVIQAAVADLPPEPEPENEPEPPVAEIIRPAKPKPEPLGRLTAASMTITPEIAKRIQSGGQMTKYKQNIAAIHTMRQILQEGRRPTVDEQETMAMYAGFGGIKPIFYPYDYTLGIDNRERQKWAKAQDELRELIGDKAYDAARDSTKNAHFTDPHIVQSMWQVAKHLGFTGGRMLEPSVGIGNFIGLMPEDLRGTTSVTGVELDLTTGEMARMLYPDANIKIQGFEKLNAPDGFYDLAIGNVPFGDYTVSDSRYNKFSANIHNYFFLKAMDKVRPGGLAMFITSTGTMDAARAKIVRKALAEQADLVTAIRFPAETFAKTALTSVVTDLVILRKRLPGEEPKDNTWVESERVENPDGGKPIWLNTWLDKNRQNMLGEFNGRNRMYPNRANVDRTDDFEDRFRAVIDNLPQGIMSAVASSKTALKEAGANVKNGGYVIDNGRLMANVRNKGLVEIEATPDRIRRVTGLLGIRDVFNKLSDAELGRSSDSPEKLRRDLNSAYDAFIARHGIINDKKNLTALADDPDLPRLQALENYDSKTKTAKKMPVFTKSTVVGSLSKSKPTTIVEGVVKSFSQTGKIDPAMIAEDLGLDLDTVGSELVERGIAYHTPQGQWELAAHYLSGNVRRKLAEARLAVATYQEFQPNVDALERVVPRDVPHTNIAVEMGAPWMDPKVIADFVGDLFKDNSDNTKVFYDRNLGTYTVNYLSGSRAKGSMEATSTWGTPRVPFDELLSLALAGKSPRVVDWVKDADGTRREVFLPAQTQQAQTKMDAIKQRFKEWVWQDEERRNALTTRYNEQFNSLVPSRYDVSFMLDKPEKGKPRGGSIPGMNPDWKLRPHQLAGVFRAIIEQRGLFAHEVGLGKTLTMIASASELKRLGIAKKPAIAVPKKVLPGFAATAREVFPLLKLHVIDAEDAASRNRTMSQVATGDHDLVLMTHDNMDMLKMRPEFEAEMLQKELDEVDAVYYAMAAENRKATKSSAEGKIMAQILKRREKLAAKIKTALESERKDDTITFEDTGIDFLMVDEFHKYKSLPVITALGQVKGVPTNDSQRATNMFMRVRYLQSIQRGGGIIGATGTPISNSLVEAYIVSKYLQPDLLEEAGVQSFDAWVRNFASVVSALEMGATQEWKVVSRLSEFKNLPELKMLSRMTLDVQTAEKTGILEKRPKRIDTVADVKQSPTQQVYMKVLKERADRIKSGMVDKSIDNYLVLSTDGMMMALDPRLVLPDWKEEGSKLLALTDNVMRIHKAKPDMAQMIFCDVGVGATAWGFRYYDAVIDKLVSAGIPREKIIDFSKLNTDKKVETAVARLNSGDALVAIGHRENMGTGVNAQDRMAAIYQLDPPWKPSAIEQSEARGWREGNLNEEVEIIPYVGSGSFDAVKWATVSRKHQGIRSFMADEVGTDRTLEETDDDALSYDQIAAVASGDGDYLRKAELDAKVFKLENMQRAHESDRLNREHQMNALPIYIKEAERKIVELDQVSDAAAEIQEKPFSYITVKGEVIEDKKEAAKVLSSEFLFTKDKKEKVNLGYYKGAKLVGDGYGWTHIEIKPKGSYEVKGYNFNVNTTEFIGTIQSLEKTVAGLADRGNQEYLRNTKIPMLKKDIEELAKVATAPFPFDEQLAKAKKQLDAVKKRLAAKESANAAEGEPLVSKGLDVRAVASLGRDVRRGLREKEMTPADVRRIIDQRMPEIEASTKDAVEMWQMVQRRKAEEFLESMDNDTGLAGMAITAASARREQALYDPELDSSPPASLGKPRTRDDVTNSPEFKQWFGNSIVTENGKPGGKPLVVYHGTDGDFDTFRPSKYGSVGPGVYFSTSPDVASFHGKTVIPAYVKIENSRDGIVAGHEVVVRNPKNIKSAIGNRGTFDGSSNLLTHRGEPKATELANPLDALLYQSTITKSRGSRGVRMYVNDHARAILGAALTEVFQRDYTNVNAINLARDEVYRLSTYLDKEAGRLPGEYKKGAEAFAQSLRQMVDDSKGQRTFNIVDITPFAERHEGEVRSDVDKAVEQFKGTIREESFHWSQRQVNGQSIALVGSSWAQSSKGYAKYRKALVDRGYPDDPETIAAEAAAKIAAGLYDELGIRSEADHQQAAAWLASYFDRVAEKHGLDALDKFDRLLQPAKAAKEKGATSARERLAERIKQDKERATVASNRPRAPGGGGETIQTDEASKSERRQEPVYKADIDAPFEGGKIKGPQLPLSEQVNSQNVRLAGEEKPSVGGAGFGGKPPKGPRPLFNEEPAEPPKPWEREPKQRSFGEEEPSFDKAGNPTGRWKKFFENLSDVINIPKALRATFDLSATLRQAFYMAAPHPILGIKSFGRQIKSLKQVNYDAFYKWLKNHPAYKDAKAAGLEFSGDNPLNLNEENFGTRFAGKIPGVAMAERAFVTMLDSMRIEVFDLYRKTANKQFKDPRERFESYEAAASWINKTSGRADFGKGKYGNFMRNAAIPFLNVFGWSPRFVYSRFQMLNPWTYAQNLKNAPRRAVFVRQVAEIFQTAATLVATGALATAAGGNVSLDEDDPDFLKIRFGTTRYDVLAGVQQAARLAIKIGKWIESRGMEDDEKKLKKISRDTAAAIPRFARTKLAPVPGFFTDWINDWVKVTGEVHRPGEFWGMAKEGDYPGAAAEFVNDPVLSLAMPMMFSNVVEAYVKGYRGGTLYGDEADHLKGLMKVGLIEPFEFMGLGVQDYDRPEWKKETEQKLEELDYDPKFPKRFNGEKEKDYQARVRRVIAEKEDAINRFSSDPNMKSQPKERAKELLRSEMSSEGMERLKKIRPEDIENDRMVRAWILVGVERLKKNPVYQQMSEDDQKKALKSYHSRMNNYRAEPANSQHEYIAPDVVDEDLLKKKIDEAIRSRRPNQ